MILRYLILENEFYTLEFFDVLLMLSRPSKILVFYRWRHCCKTLSLNTDLSTLKAGDLSGLAYSYRRMGVDDASKYEEIVVNILKRNLMDEMNGKQLMMLANTYAKLQIMNKEILFEEISRTAISKLNVLEFQHLAIILWSFSKLRIKHVDLFSAASNVIINRRMMYQFNPQNISNTVWAFSKVGINDQKLLTTASSAILDRGLMYDFNPQEIANILWSFAFSHTSDVKFFMEASKAIVERNILYDFNPQDITNTLFAFAHAGMYDHVLFSKISECIIKRNMIMKEFNVQNIAQTMFAVSISGFHDRNIYRECLLAIKKRPEISSSASKGDKRMLMRAAKRIPAEHVSDIYLLL